MKRIYGILGWMAAVLLMACSDDLYEVIGEDRTAVGDCLSFSVSTTEMYEQLTPLGSTTRGMADTTDTRRTDIFREHELQGDNPYGMRAYSLPMPAVGIHKGTVHATTEDTKEQTTRTLGAVINTSGSNFHDSITIWGYTNAAENEVLFRQILLRKIRNWRSDVNWPYSLIGTQMTFYAVAPSMESIDMSANDNTAGFDKPPVLTYTLPDNINEMVDLLYGTSNPKGIDIKAGPSGTITTDPRVENLGKDNKYIHLTFSHILTAIRFSKGSIPDGVTITAIQLESVPTSGTFTPDDEDAYTGTEGAWSGQSVSRTITVPVSFTGGARGDYIDGGRVLFMIPQRLTQTSKLNITLTENVGGKVHNLTCSLDKDEWKKGYTVNYQITVGRLEDQYVLTVDQPAEHEHSTSRTFGSFNLHSYHNYKDYSAGGTPTDYHHPVSWQVVGYSADGTNFYEAKNDASHANSLEWLERIDGTTETSGGYAVTVDYTLLGQSPASTINHEENLIRNTTVTSASALDLSKYTPNNTAMTEETANCYIVNRQGSYKFPLVYGNKTADGAEDACFKDHTGAVISHKLIKEQMMAKNPSTRVYDPLDDNLRRYTEYKWDSKTLKAEIVWQDVRELISSVSAVSSSDMMQFSINQSVPGNAVIALKGRKVTVYEKKDEKGAWVLDVTKEGTNDGYEYGEWETYWTWHIWMTDEVYKNDGTVNVGSSTGVDVNTLFLNWNKVDHLVTIENYDKVTNQILPVNLGWVPDNPDYSLYKPRTVWVKLKQSKPEGDGKECVVKILQNARQPLYTGTGTVYQWGRPTAFPSIKRVDNSLRTIYDGTGANITNQFKIAQLVNDGAPIAEPFSILQMSDNLNSWFPVDTYTDAQWRSTKTVYDPCPPGFQIPSYAIFSGFSRTGGESKDGTGLNIYPDKDDQKSAEGGKGGYFFTNKYVNDESVNRYAPVVYMPSTGEYHGNKSIGQEMSATASYFDNMYGIFWTNDYVKANNSKAPALWLTPDWEYIGTEDTAVSEGKPAYKAKSIDSYSSLRQVRPMKKKN